VSSEKEEEMAARGVPKSVSRKVNGYVKAVLRLEEVRRKREERYDRYVRPLDRKREALAAEVAVRAKALSGGQYAEAKRILGGIAGLDRQIPAIGLDPLVDPQ
jgi:hypothetical protein